MGGRGCGKSIVGAYDLLRRAKPGRRYLVAAPTYPMLRDATYRSFREVAERLHQWQGVRKTEFICDISTWQGGSAEVAFRSADDPEKLRGPNLTGCWLDEASLMHQDAFAIALACLREGGEQGWMTATFTPKGLVHWTYDTFGKAAPGVALFHARSSDNPFLAPEFLDMVKSQYAGSRALQELEGQFVDVEGAEWPATLFGPEIWFDDWPPGIQLRTIGLDPSKGRDAKAGDFSAFALLGRSHDGTLWCEADLRRDRSAEVIVAQGVEHVRTFRPDVLAVEADLFQELFVVLFQAASRSCGFPLPVMPLTTGGVPKVVRIRRLGGHLVGRRIRFRKTPGTEELVRQLQVFPVGEYDDGPDALEIALRAMVELCHGRQKHGRAQGALR